MTEPALAMLAGGVTMRPPSQHRWDGTDLLASRYAELHVHRWRIRIGNRYGLRRSGLRDVCRNGTGQTVVVYELGAYQTGDRGFELQPGETKTSYWFRPRDENDKQETKVRAVNSAGSLVFCRAYSYERAKDNFHWTIRITQGITDC